MDVNCLKNHIKKKRKDEGEIQLRKIRWPSHNINRKGDEILGVTLTAPYQTTTA
jgi:hypothetical protein